MNMKNYRLLFSTSFIVIIVIIIIWKSLSNINLCTTRLIRIGNNNVENTDNITNGINKFQNNISNSTTNNIKNNSIIQLNKKKYYLVIMTKVKIVSNIGLCRLIEWIEYNLLIGFEHIYINDDCSEEAMNLKQNLENYIKLDLITLVPTFNDYNKECIDHKPNESRNTKLMLENYVKYDCEWIANIDMDEYITFWNNRYNLKDMLMNSNIPIIRLTWWMMGSDGHETIPPGLLIEGSHYGEFNKYHIKSIAKRDEIREWSFQLFPFFKDSQRLLPNGMSLKNYTEHDECWDFESNTINMKSNSFKIPTTQIFLKHYRYTSYEEYSLQRGSLKNVASGLDNPWKRLGKKLWLEGNYARMNIADQFTSDKAIELRKLLVSRGLMETSVCNMYWKL